MKYIIALIGVSAALTISLIGLSGFVPNNKTPEPQLNDTKMGATPLPKLVHHKVDFAAQAPFGDWKDKRQAYGCEETSVIMALHWARATDNQREALTKNEAMEEIVASSDYQQKYFGYFEDTSAKDTLERIIKDYFKYDKATLAYDININDIKKELADNRLVIVPVNGSILKNPYYKVPYHMILIIGYDDKTQEFITNDPGTRHGKDLRYSYEVMSRALSDYTSSNGKATLENRTAMIVVSKQRI